MDKLRRHIRCRAIEGEESCVVSLSNIDVLLNTEIVISKDYYRAFNSDSERYAVAAGDYLNPDSEIPAGFMCPEFPVSKVLAPEISLTDLSFPVLNKDAIGMMHLGRDSAASPIHFDWDHRWVAHACITGSKRFILLPPSAGWLLCPVVNTSALHVPSFSTSDRKTLLKLLGGTEIELNAGEGILFPSTYWHGVAYEEPSSALSIRFEADFGGRPFSVLPRSWYLQRIVFEFFRTGYKADAIEFLNEYLGVFFYRHSSWIERYKEVRRVCMKCLKEKGKERGAAAWIEDNFIPELALASDELREYYDLSLYQVDSVKKSELSDTVLYLTEGISGLREDALWQLAAYAKAVRQGLEPRRGYVKIV